MTDHEVQQGECLLTIAEDYGFLWETLWNYPANSQLKDERKDPNVLRPGDILRIPDIRVKEYARATEKKHPFRKKGNRAKVRMQLLDYEHRPRKNVSYVANLDGELQRGTTDDQGYFVIRALPTAKNLRVEATENGETDLYEFSLGHVDPVETMSGVRQRLINLGYNCAPGDGDIDDELTSAIKEFQRKTKLNDTGNLDGATRDKLKRVHQC